MVRSATAFLSRCEAAVSARLDGGDHRRLWLGGALMIVLGIKFLLIAYAGSAVPYWDQWDAEAEDLIVPYMAGTLTGADLLAAHNEHRILFTRLITLALLEFGGGWNPVFEMTVNAFIHVLVIGLLLYLVRPFARGGASIVLAVAVVLLFGLPFAHENTLAGFQSQFYLLTGSAAVAVAVLTTRPAFDPRWLAGVLLAGLSLGNMASAAFTPVVVVAVTAVQILLGVRPRTPREFVGLAVLLGLGAAMFAAVPTVPAHEVHQAQSFARFVLAFLVSAGWPIVVPPFGFLIVQGPLLVLAVRQAMRPPPLDSARWRLLALGAWIGAQYVSLAYGRAVNPLASRYIDLIALGVFVNLVVLVLLVREAAVERPRWRARAVPVGTLWLGTVTACLVMYAGWWSTNSLVTATERRTVQQANLTRFVAAGDRAALDQPYLAIPYPDADRLAMILSRPAIRGVLPTELGATEAERDQARSRLTLGGGVRLTTPRVRIVARTLGSLLLAIGAGLWMVSAGWTLLVGPSRLERSASPGANAPPSEL